MQVLVGTPRFRLTTYEYRFNAKNEQVASWLLVTGARQHFIKVRYTCAASKAGEGNRALESFLIAFFNANGYK